MTRTTRPTFQAERGERQEARILAALANGPQSSKALAAALSLSVDSINIYVKRLRVKPRRIYVAEFDHNGVNQPANKYAAGDLPDVLINERHGDRQRALLRHHLKTPRTAAELQALMGLSRPQVITYLTELREATPKLAYIKEFRYVQHAEKARQIPVYALGNKPDAKPRRRTAAEEWAELTDEQRESRRRRQRTYEALCRARARPQGIFSALGL